MNDNSSLQAVQRKMLLRSIYVLVTPIFMIFAILACAGTALMGSPAYTCPTPIPPATSTVLAGTAIPTLAAPPTPYVILPPADFYVGDVIFVGSSSSEHGVRFRLQNVMSYPASPDANGDARTITTWQLEVRNIGTADYEIFPTAQMFLNEINTAYGTVNGVWPATREAADEAGVTLDDDAYTLNSGEMRVFRFAAFSPAGQATRFTFQLDPTISEGSAVIHWTNHTNPYCAGDISDP
jgi:hypothetical protein